jgi:hypothetical protein
LCGDEISEKWRSLVEYFYLSFYQDITRSHFSDFPRYGKKVISYETKIVLIMTLKYSEN